MINITVYKEAESGEGYEYNEMLVNPKQIVSIGSYMVDDQLYQLTLPNIDDCYLTDEEGKDKIVGALR